MLAEIRRGARAHNADPPPDEQQADDQRGGGANPQGGCCRRRYPAARALRAAVAAHAAGDRFVSAVPDLGALDAAVHPALAQQCGPEVGGSRAGARGAAQRQRALKSKKVLRHVWRSGEPSTYPTCPSPPQAAHPQSPTPRAECAPAEISRTGGPSGPSACKSSPPPSQIGKSSACHRCWFDKWCALLPAATRLRPRARRLRAFAAPGRRRSLPTRCPPPPPFPATGSPQSCFGTSSERRAACR